jgi:general secretion pathway protein J
MALATTPRRLRGFTLIELLVAIAIMAVMAVLSWRGVDAMMRSQERTQAHSAANSRLSAGLAQWRADLQAAQTTGRTPTIDFDGRLLRLTRRESDPDAPSTRVVAWSLRGEQWLRWQSAPLLSQGDVDQAWLQAQQWASNPSERLRAQEVAITGAEQWQVFFYRSDAWVNPQSSSVDAATLGNGLQVQNMPQGVRLVLKVQGAEGASGALTLDWANPTVGGGKS